MTNEQGAIEERLEKLERQNRRMKLAGLGAMVIAGAFVLMGQASGPRTPSEVRAKSFVLVDANGETRARLYMSASANGPELTLLDAKGNERLTLYGPPIGPTLALSDANGEVRAGLAVTSDRPWLTLYDAKGNPRVVLDANSEGAGLALSDANGEVRAGLAVTSDGPGLVLSDANEKPQAGLAVTSDGAGLQLNDPSGFETDIGVTDLITPATDETHKTSAASIVLFGKDKKVLWSAPPQN
jgi:hypothetical protein